MSKKKYSTLGPFFLKLTVGGDMYPDIGGDERSFCLVGLCVVGGPGSRMDRVFPLLKVIRVKGGGDNFRIAPVRDGVAPCVRIDVASNNYVE